jgi:hypothetical protein
VRSITIAYNKFFKPAREHQSSGKIDALWLFSEISGEFILFNGPQKLDLTPQARFIIEQFLLTLEKHH